MSLFTTVKSYFFSDEAGQSYRLLFKSRNQGFIPTAEDAAKLLEACGAKSTNVILNSLETVSDKLFYCRDVSSFKLVAPFQNAFVNVQFSRNSTQTTNPAFEGCVDIVEQLLPMYRANLNSGIDFDCELYDPAVYMKDLIIMGLTISVPVILIALCVRQFRGNKTTAETTEENKPLVEELEHNQQYTV